MESSRYWFPLVPWFLMRFLLKMWLSGRGSTAGFWSFEGLAIQPCTGEPPGVDHTDCWSINRASLFQIVSNLFIQLLERLNNFCL